MAKKSSSKTKVLNGTLGTVSASEKETSFPVVGIGASAGGLQAFEAFFSGIPTDKDPNMAFVLVQHLDPDHKSMLTELIQRYTRMQVFEVEDGMEVQANCTYIIPPNRDMALIKGRLQLLEPSVARGKRLPIDFFFRSLAEDQHERAIGIILSGTGGDGTQGIRAIKAEGGMVIAQKPDSAEYDGMPSSAISTGLVDFVLVPVQMPAQLIAYATHSKSVFGSVKVSPALKEENALNKIFILLRAQTSNDFSHYKSSTVNRRIERRMALHQIETLENYVKYLQQAPDEIEALFHELLIGVTNFFRDPVAFESLKQNLDKLFSGRLPNTVIRVWVTGCSTGEEAYSVAIILYEYMQGLKESYTVQVFATDIDPDAIATARMGIYPAGIATDISPERLSNFFTVESEGSSYRIRKKIRDMLIFSVHNLIKDPPFSKLDLISCRNLLIYMDAELQKKLVPLFHYALNPRGILYLGTSETIGEFGNLFAVLDNKAKIFQRKEDIYGTNRMAMERILPSVVATPAIATQDVKKSMPDVKLPLRELSERTLLEQITPAAALVNEQGDILYLHGKAGIYLQLPSGEVSTNNILKMTKEELHSGLIVALHKAKATKEIVRSAGYKVRINGDFKMVNLLVSPVVKENASAIELPLYLVVFEEGPLPDDKKADSTDTGGNTSFSDTDSRIVTLTQELHAQEEFLKTANEKLKTSNEELRSSNEEIQSMNEELQSTNEELETSKEELQSVNEELSTVNAELQTKVMDLSRSNNDMNNLLAGTGIGTVFVDHNLCILRFTPAATKIINLIPSDLGRPVDHLVSNLIGYDSLKEDVQKVLDTLIPKEIEVQTKEGQWYIMRIQPYRTLDNIIEGAVITFVDISETVQMREALRKANKQMARLAIVVRDANDAITVQDLNGRLLAWNPGAERMYGWSETEALKMNIRDLIPKAYLEEALSKIIQLNQLETLEPSRSKRIRKDGTVADVSITSTALINERGEMYAIATTEREVK